VEAPASAINWQLTSRGTCLAGLSLLAPLLIGVKEFGILPLMEASILDNSAGLLLVASLRLVILNTLRALPLYTGVLLAAEGLGLFRSRAPLLALLPVMFIPAAYEIIRTIYGITYDYGIPAFALTLGVLLFSRVQDMARRVIHKIIIFSLLLFGLEWLDIVPLLSGFWFGRGEISTDIKIIASFLHAEDVLNITGLAFSSIFVTNAFITARLLSVYTKEIHAVEQARQLESMAAQLSLQTLENRSLREMQSLVHDLKTPLTTIQGLADVIAMGDQEPAREYARYISQSSNKMSIMISELLKADVRQILSAAELVEYAVAHMPQLSRLGILSLRLPDQAPFISANKIQMSRAISNLLENALEAIPAQTGKIVVTLSSSPGEAVISVADNGAGISADQLERIWDVGFSTKASSGIGLPYVHEVVTSGCGRISVDSNLGQGTTFTIRLPEVPASE
jgi:signal transduction histidine kinase